MSKREFVQMHKRFSEVFNQELRNHHIKSTAFRAECGMKHDDYALLKKEAN